MYVKHAIRVDWTLRRCLSQSKGLNPQHEPSIKQEHEHMRANLYFRVQEKQVYAG